MKFDVITAFPEMITQGMSWGVIGKAAEKKIYSLNTINPRQFTQDVHKTIDDRPFGGGDGMVMLYDPLAQAVESVDQWQKSRRVYLSPAGKLLREPLVQELAKEDHLILLCGRYGGVDQRLLQQYDFESISVGDYVLSGGELPALSLMDAVLRKQPGVLGNEESSTSDSFASDSGLEAPLYTRPRENAAGVVPEVLLGGDHKKIQEWRLRVGQALTRQNRPELVGKNFPYEDLKKYFKSWSSEQLQQVGLTEDFLQTLGTKEK